jgi:hypothetical protein
LYTFIIDFPKSHDIGEISILLPPGMSVPISVKDREKLTGYAWKGRYPGDFEPINRQHAEDAVALAVKVRVLLRSGFPKDILGSDPRFNPNAQEPPAVYVVGGYKTKKTAVKRTRERERPKARH